MLLIEVIIHSVKTIKIPRHDEGAIRVSPYDWSAEFFAGLDY